MIAVAEKVLRVEAFGIECAIFARDLSWQWVSDVRDLYSVGDRVLVRVQEISGEDAEHLSIRADIRSTFSETSVDNLKKCQVQSKYAGKVTDLRGGVVYIRLNNGVNAIAHTCYDSRMPGKRTMSALRSHGWMKNTALPSALSRGSSSGTCNLAAFCL